MLRTSIAAGLTILAFSSGCGLGFVEIVPDQDVSFRIENETPETAEVTISVQQGVAQDQNASDSETLVNVPGGNTANGTLSCGDRITLTAVTGVGSGSKTVQFTGSGTGTPGFDSGTVGQQGERFLVAGDHFECTDTILIRILTTETGEIAVLAEGSSLPEQDPAVDPVMPTSPGTGIRTSITVRLENATATTSDILITPTVAGSGDGPSPGGVPSVLNPSDSAQTATPTSVRVPAGQFTVGEIECGPAYTVSGTMVDDNGSVVQFTGDGTGTAGFDSASVGPDGERLLLFGDHYGCGNAIVVRITDDGSGIGANTNETARGEVNVFSSGEAVPEPSLPDPNDPSDEQAVAEMTIVLVNAVERVVQMNVATGSGMLVGSGGINVASEFNVRVPPGAQSTGTTPCAQEFVIAASHLEAKGTTAAPDSGDGIFAGGGSAIFHSVVLTGAGTGTEGFDSNSLAILRGRLLQLGTHFECGDTITVTVTATNNQIQLDETGAPVLDQFGNPTIKYNVGSGFVTVAPGP